MKKKKQTNKNNTIYAICAISKLIRMIQFVIKYQIGTEFKYNLYSYKMWQVIIGLFYFIRFY